jgi:hypothetical protein
MAQAKSTHTPILDTYGVAEAFATELAVLENLGPCYRLVFTVSQTSHNGGTELAPVIRLVLPIEAVQQMLADIPIMMRNLPSMKIAQEDRAHLN